MATKDDKQETINAQMENIDNESFADNAADIKVAEQLMHAINQPHAEIYAEAIARYPTDESIDQADEDRLKRKLDRRIIPLLGICYFFYVRAGHFIHR
jgi:uncharacterized protein YbcC (UPF0753/DUF2309 family)